MPEGDTIFRAARTLHRALAGKPVVRFESVFPALTRVHVDTPLTAQTIESVSASGKHLLMRFSGGLVLRTHMRMNGSWHIYRPRETWQRPRRDMRIVVATADFVAVGFNIPVAEFFAAAPSRATRSFAGSDPTCCRTTSTRTRRCGGSRRAPATADRRRAAQPAGRRRHRQRLQVRGAVRLPHQSVRQVGDLELDAVRCLIATARRLLLANVPIRRWRR